MKVGQVYQRNDRDGEQSYYVCVGRVDVEDQDVRALVNELDGIKYAVCHLMDQVEVLSQKEKISHNKLWKLVAKIIPEVDTGEHEHDFNHVTGHVSRKLTWSERQAIEKEWRKARVKAIELLKGDTYECTECGHEHYRTSIIGKKHAKFEKSPEPPFEYTVEKFLETKMLPTGPQEII